MNSKLLEEASQIIGDPNVLVNLVSKRIKEISRGKSPLVKALPSTSPVDIVLTEIIEEKIKPILS